MFGPNTPRNINISTSSSHRNIEFKEKYITCCKLFSDAFSLNNYDIILMPGSASIGIESIFFSSKHHINVIGNEGKFTKRRKDLSLLYNPTKDNDKTLELYCQLETSSGERLDTTGCIVDAISSFPYKPIPSDSLMFVTSPNKQLGSLAGISIIGVRKDSRNIVKEQNIFSYLNLYPYKESPVTGNVVTTFPEQNIDDLINSLYNFDRKKLCKHINDVSQLITNKYNIKIEEAGSPVILLPKEKVSINIARKYDLYGLGNNETNYYSIFTYSHPIEDYESFVKDFQTI